VPYLTFIEQCLREAADLARGTVDRRVVLTRPDDPNQVVTRADLAISAALTARIRERYPRHSILDEESGLAKRGSDHTWIVDPLDGSSNYSVGSPHYGTMIALAERGDVIAAGVILPEFDECLLAARGDGAYRNGTWFRTPEKHDLTGCLVTYGLDKDLPERLWNAGCEIAALGGRCLGIRMTNSVYDAVQVLTGVYGGFIHHGTRVWDVAALYGIAQESGARTATLAGEKLDFARHMSSASTLCPVVLCAPGLEWELCLQPSPKTEY
jgi:myo-inositol-1(or 4)-monophosphatase